MMQISRMSLSGSLLLSVAAAVCIFPGVSCAASLGEAEAGGRVDELAACLAITLSRTDEQDARAYVDLVSPEKSLQQWAADCTKKHLTDYDAEDMASYAMGVSLQRKLLQEYESLDWVDFMNGLLRANSRSVKVSIAEIDKLLEMTLLGDAEASQQYLEKFAQSEDVEEHSGVFFKKIFQESSIVEVDSSVDSSSAVASETDPGNTAEMLWVQAFSEQSLCAEPRNTDNVRRRVRFHLVKPIDTDIENDEVASPQINCIAYQADDVIRGWRLLMDELEPKVIYDVAIPSELAYGSSGVEGVVEGGESLRFLMQVDDL